MSPSIAHEVIPYAHNGMYMPTRPASFRCVLREIATKEAGGTDATIMDRQFIAHPAELHRVYSMSAPKSSISITACRGLPELNEHVLTTFGEAPTPISSTSTGIYTLDLQHKTILFQSMLSRSEAPHSSPHEPVLSSFGTIQVSSTFIILSDNAVCSSSIRCSFPSDWYGRSRRSSITAMASVKFRTPYPSPPPVLGHGWCIHI